MISPELNEYPDSGKLWGLASPRAASTTPTHKKIVGRSENNLDYFEGEM